MIESKDDDQSKVDDDSKAVDNIELGPCFVSTVVCLMN